MMKRSLKKMAGFGGAIVESVPLSVERKSKELVLVIRRLFEEPSKNRFASPFCADIPPVSLACARR